VSLDEPAVGQLLAAVAGHTYLEPQKLRSLIARVAAVDAAHVPGDRVECGVFKGGSEAVLARVMAPGRHLWLYDSFQGMPETNARDGETARQWIGACRADPSDVLAIMGATGTAGDRYTLRIGLFAQTFTVALPPAVALLHLDCDWYDSVTLALETFYDRMPPGGIVILDDFGWWEGCREAFYDFCARRREAPLLERVGRDQAWWSKGCHHNRPA
jgi:O-methyltransferase